jgi:hypothetical protein
MDGRSKPSLALTMESLIKGVLAQPTLPDNVKSAVIANLLGKASLDTPDAIVMLELGVELKSNVCEIHASQ